MKPIDLFCLPFAGGNKYSFRPYEKFVPSPINLITLEYPGRGARMSEPLLSDAVQLVPDLCSQVMQRISGNPYAIYGHSLGALLAFLLTRQLLAGGCAAPLHLFVSGAGGPAGFLQEKQRHLLPRNLLLEEIKKMGGTQAAVLDHEELLEIFEPVIRADLRICDTYAYEPAAPLNIPVTVITGTEEPIPEERILLWGKETTGPVQFRKLPGDHFFIFDHPAALMSCISGQLSKTSTLP